MESTAYIKLRDESIKQARINYEFWADSESNVVNNIEYNLGDPIACLLSLVRIAKYRATLAWFEGNNLTSFRQWSFVSARLNQKYILSRNSTFEPFLKNIDLLEPLMSNNPALITWFANYDAVYDMKRVEKLSTVDYFAYQSIVALRGDWSRLSERCKQVIDNPPPSLKRWQEYHHFYLALAEQDLVKMESVLREMVEPKKVRSRLSEETVITENLIFSRIIIAIKIAWLHGFEVKVDSPYVPMEWMPMTPLTQYDNVYSFLS